MTNISDKLLFPRSANKVSSNNALLRHQHVRLEWWRTHGKSAHIDPPVLGATHRVVTKHWRMLDTIYNIHSN